MRPELNKEDESNQLFFDMEMPDSDHSPFSSSSSKELKMFPVESIPMPLKPDVIEKLKKNVLGVNYFFLLENSSLLEAGSRDLQSYWDTLFKENSLRMLSQYLNDDNKLKILSCEIFEKVKFSDDRKIQFSRHVDDKKIEKIYNNFMKEDADKICTRENFLKTFVRAAVEKFKTSNDVFLNVNGLHCSLRDSLRFFSELRDGDSLNQKFKSLYKEFKEQESFSVSPEVDQAIQKDALAAFKQIMANNLISPARHSM